LSCLAVASPYPLWAGIGSRRYQPSRFHGHCWDSSSAFTNGNKAFTKLLGLQYKICYHKGPENSAADALSRRQHENLHAVHTVTTCQPLWLDELRDSYSSNNQVQRWIQKPIVKLRLKPFMNMGLELFKQMGSLLWTVQAAKDNSLLDGDVHCSGPRRHASPLICLRASSSWQSTARAPQTAGTILISTVFSWEAKAKNNQSISTDMSHISMWKPHRI
jgi:hypothetical protein